MAIARIDSRRMLEVAKALRANWELASQGTDAVSLSVMSAASQDPSSPLHDAAKTLLSLDASSAAFKFFDWTALDDFGTDGWFFDSRVTQAGLDRAIGTLNPDLTEAELADSVKHFFSHMDLFGPEHGLDGSIHKAELIQAVELDPNDTELNMMHRLEHSTRPDQLRLWNTMSVLLETGLFEKWAARSGDPTTLDASDLGLE
jgi:hypothetical protein